MRTLYLLTSLTIACGNQEPEPSGNDSDTPIVDTHSPSDTSAAIDTGQEDSKDPCLVEPPTLEIGTGSHAFESLEDYDELEMAWTPAAGWEMVWAIDACHVTSFAALQIAIIHQESGTALTDIPYNVALEPDEKRVCCYQAVGLFTYLDISDMPGAKKRTPPDLLDGAVLETTITLQNPDDDIEVTDTRLVTAVCKESC